jgi:hypothetical protein
MVDLLAEDKDTLALREQLTGNIQKLATKRAKTTPSTISLLPLLSITTILLRVRGLNLSLLLLNHQKISKPWRSLDSEKHFQEKGIKPCSH